MAAQPRRWSARVLLVAGALLGLACDDRADGANDAGSFGAQDGGAMISASSDARVAADGARPAATDAQVSTTDAFVPEVGALADAGRMDASAASVLEASVSDASADATVSNAPVLPPVTATDKPGPFQTTRDLAAGPQKKSGLFRPSELGRDGLKHPIFVWGCGGGSTPSSYSEHLTQIASHGFVVIAEVSAIGDNGAPLKASIDWLIAENARPDSPLHEKLNTSKIALGGHSIGSVNSFLIADDPRLTTTLHVAGGSLDNVNDPRAPTTGMGGKRLIHPVAYICSESDSFGNVEKSEKDYAQTSVPAFITVITGSTHTAAARDGLPAIIAWLRWHLAGELERRGAFLEPQREFTQGKFVSRSKNW